VCMHDLSMQPGKVRPVSARTQIRSEAARGAWHAMHGRNSTAAWERVHTSAPVPAGSRAGCRSRDGCNATRAQERVTAARAYAACAMAALRARAPRQRARARSDGHGRSKPPWPRASIACVAFVSGAGRPAPELVRRTLAAAEPVRAPAGRFCCCALVQCTLGGVVTGSLGLVFFCEN
jgi:hypothetical protein